MWKSGMIGCIDETCSNEILKTTDSEFCISDGLRLMTDISNVFDYLSC
ncbi:MAG: hypothetical protein MRQ13_04270 [Candidatus Midichloria sp.]|nr:hypothetical protein [Candidatus Midichloria sp.]